MIFYLTQTGKAKNLFGWASLAVFILAPWGRGKGEGSSLFNGPIHLNAGFRPHTTSHFCFGKSAQNHSCPCTAPWGSLHLRIELNGSETRSAQTVFAKESNSILRFRRAQRIRQTEIRPRGKD